MALQPSYTLTTILPSSCNEALGSKVDGITVTAKPIKFNTLAE